MISDILFEASEGIERYMDDSDMYKDMHQELDALLAHMAVIKNKLDKPPLPMDAVIIMPEQRMTVREARKKGYEI